MSTRKAAPTATDPTLAELVDTYGMWVSYATAAKITSVSTRTLRRLTERGELPCYAPGSTRTLRLRTADVAALMERVA